MLDAIVAHARADAPLECCGLLIGSGDLVDEHYPVRNVRQSRVAFEVDPAGHFAAIRKARASQRAVIGAYHSHPASAPVPSRTDVQDAHDAELLHLIVSLATSPAVTGAYRINGNEVTRIELEVVDV